MVLLLLLILTPPATATTTCAATAATTAAATEGSTATTAAMQVSAAAAVLNGASAAALTAAHSLLPTVGLHPRNLAAIDIAEPRGVPGPCVRSSGYLRLAGRAADIARPLDVRPRDVTPTCGRARRRPLQVGAGSCEIAAGPALQTLQRALANISGLRASISQVCCSVPLDVGRPVADRICPVRLNPVPDVRPVELGELGSVEVNLPAVDILPVDVVEIDLPLKSTLLRHLLQSMSMSPPSQPPPQTPQSFQSTAAAHTAPVTAAAKKVAVGYQ